MLSLWCMHLNKSFLAGLLSLLAVVAVGAADGANAPVELNGSFQIRNQKFGDLLRPKDASNAEGAPIVLYPAEPWKCMTWRVTPATNSTCQVQNHFTSKTFTVKAGSTENRLTQTAWSKEAGQRPQWKFTPLGDGSYKICSAKADYALTARESGGTVGILLAPWKDEPEQKWKLEAI